MKFSLELFASCYPQKMFGENAIIIRELTSEYNRLHRLKITNKSNWPRQELINLERHFIPFMLPPPMPTEYIDET